VEVCLERPLELSSSAERGRRRRGRNCPRLTIVCYKWFQRRFPFQPKSPSGASNDAYAFPSHIRGAAETLLLAPLSLSRQKWCNSVHLSSLPPHTGYPLLTRRRRRELKGCYKQVGKLIDTGRQYRVSAFCRLVRRFIWRLTRRREGQPAQRGAAQPGQGGVGGPPLSPSHPLPRAIRSQ